MKKDVDDKIADFMETKKPKKFFYLLGMKQFEYNKSLLTLAKHPDPFPDFYEIMFREAYYNIMNK